MILGLMQKYWLYISILLLGSMYIYNFGILVQWQYLREVNGLAKDDIIPHRSDKMENKKDFYCKIKLKLLVFSFIVSLVLTLLIYNFYGLNVKGKYLEIAVNTFIYFSLFVYAKNDSEEDNISSDHEINFLAPFFAFISKIKETIVTTAIATEKQALKEYISHILNAWDKSDINDEAKLTAFILAMVEDKLSWIENHVENREEIDSLCQELIESYVEEKIMFTASLINTFQNNLSVKHGTTLICIVEILRKHNTKQFKGRYDEMKDKVCKSIINPQEDVTVYEDLDSLFEGMF